MSDTVDALMRHLLDWLDQSEQPYDRVMDAWRTSCPRLPVWEEANERGFLSQIHVDGRPVVRITPQGRSFLSRQA